MAHVTPINAHQQKSVPLLRRPRAPKPIKVTSTKSNKTSPHTDYHLVNDETLDSSELGNIEVEETDGKSNFVIHSIYPRGPEFFPPGKVLHSYNAVAESDQLFTEADILDEFDIYDLEAWMPPKPVLRTSKSGAMLSRQNYKKLTGWFATHVPQQDTLNTIQFSLDAGTPPARKPVPQAIIGTEYLLYTVPLYIYHFVLGRFEVWLQAMWHSIRNVQRDIIYNVMYPSACTVEFRALLDEALCGTSSVLLAEDGEEERWPTPTHNDTLFRSTTTRFFCGQGRCDSPFGKAVLKSFTLE